MIRACAQYICEIQHVPIVIFCIVCYKAFAFCANEDLICIKKIASSVSSAEPAVCPITTAFLVIREALGCSTPYDVFKRASFGFISNVSMIHLCRNIASDFLSVFLSFTVTKNSFGWSQHVAGELKKQKFCRLCGLRR